MAGLQNLAEAFAAAAQIDPNGDHARIQDGGDFPHRVVGEIEKDPGRRLMSRQLLERPDQFTVRIGHLIGRLAIEGDRSSPILEHPACDPEGGPPDPRRRRPDRAAPGEGLGEGFGNGIAGDIRVPTECPDSAPYSVALCPIKGFNGRMAPGGGCALHLPQKGRWPSKSYRRRPSSCPNMVPIPRRVKRMDKRSDGPPLSSRRRATAAMRGARGPGATG